MYLEFNESTVLGTLNVNKIKKQLPIGRMQFSIYSKYFLVAFYL